MSFVCQFPNYPGYIYFCNTVFLFINLFFVVVLIIIYRKYLFVLLIYTDDLISFHYQLLVEAFQLLCHEPIFIAFEINIYQTFFSFIFH